MLDNLKIKINVSRKLKIILKNDILETYFYKLAR